MHSFNYMIALGLLLVSDSNTTKTKLSQNGIARSYGLTIDSVP
jgi:hypothetical protein